jgi:nicotinate-nucleotide adenylyltransferase
MVRLAIENNGKLAASDIEFNLPQPSYTVETLAYIREKYPQHQFTLIMGEDNLADFHRWKNYQVILEHHQLYVYPRPHVKESALRNHPQVQMVNAPKIDISATFLRKRIADGKTIRYLVPENVETYIGLKKFFV